jgi:hypothetical protein
MQSLHSTQVGIAFTPSFKHLTCPATTSTIKTIMTLLLLTYMVPYSLTPPSMKGLLLDAKAPCCVVLPCLFAEWLSAVVLVSPPVRTMAIPRRPPGAPLKLLSMLCNPGRFEFTPWPTLGKVSCWRPSGSDPLPTALGCAFQVVPSLPFLGETALPGNLPLPPPALALIPRVCK